MYVNNQFKVAIGLTFECKYYKFEQNRATV